MSGKTDNGEPEATSGTGQRKPHVVVTGTMHWRACIGCSIAKAHAKSANALSGRWLHKPLRPPGRLGTLHARYHGLRCKGSRAIVLDLMGPQRPKVDRAVLGFLKSEALHPADFTIREVPSQPARSNNTRNLHLRHQATK
jgi:hypothetical protein